MSEYFDRARTVAVDAIGKHVVGWNAQEISAAADGFMAIGFGYPRLGITGRWAATTLRKVRPIDSFEEARSLAGALNLATCDLTNSDTLDREPWLCTHCGKRFRESRSRRTQYTQHDTVFDPRTF